MTQHRFVRNAILAGLSSTDLATIAEFLQPVALKERAVLQEPRKRGEYVYFLESGAVSLRILSADSILETAIIGYRGVLGASCLLGGCASNYQSIVLFPGNALRIQVDDLLRLMGERSQIRKRILSYEQAVAIHTAQTGLCGVRHTLQERLACWLCLSCDALSARVLPVTHDYLSTVLGLRRAGVTETLIRFEQQGLIRKMRGVLEVIDRARLEQKVCRCYGIIASAYASDERETGTALHREASA
ncbi:Crp/Fnr family transcriptional regulator [Bradyrhizobium ottawaense]|uniref:Crp/Fnr family transcriptional regulator n=1 Tax=Bradyrhizobium ottawaense TaxID=931866 RepID=UPI003838DDC3